MINIIWEGENDMKKNKALGDDEIPTVTIERGKILEIKIKLIPSTITRRY